MDNEKKKKTPKNKPFFFCAPILSKALPFNKPQKKNRPLKGKKKEKPFI